MSDIYIDEAKNWSEEEALHNFKYLESAGMFEELEKAEKIRGENPYKKQKEAQESSTPSETPRTSGGIASPPRGTASP